MPPSLRADSNEVVMLIKSQILDSILRTWSRVPGLSQRRATDALLPGLVRLLLLHADVPRPGLPVLHHGGLHHRHGGRVPQVFAVSLYTTNPITSL